MVRGRNAKAKDPAAEHLPIFSQEEYDFSFKMHAWPIGLKSTYPEELIRRIGAAVASYQAGNSAIDYTYKRYFKDNPYSMGDGSRLDLRIGTEIKKKMDLLSESVFQISCLEPKISGQFLSEWTFLRIPFSINFLLSCANRGALFESASIARMILEQIAWATVVDGFADVEKIQNTSATKSIGLLKARIAGAGRLYGWLSVHVHWAYDGHVKAMHFEDGLTSSLFATTKFKAHSLALTALVTIIAIKAFSLMREPELSSLLEGVADQTSPPSDAWAIRNQKLVPSLTALRSLIDLRTISGLFGELASHYPEDSDISDLLEIAASEFKESNGNG